MSDVIGIDWEGVPKKACDRIGKLHEFMERTLQTIKDSDLLMVSLAREVVQDDPEPGEEYPNMHATGRRALTICYQEKADA